MDGSADAKNSLLQFLNHLLDQAEAESNEPQLELRAKIKSLELEIGKVPPVSSSQPDEEEIAKKLDKISSQLNSLDTLLSSSSAEDMKVQSLLGQTADLWMPAITASADERRQFTSFSEDTNEKGKSERSLVNNINMKYQENKMSKYITPPG